MARKLLNLINKLYSFMISRKGFIIYTSLKLSVALLGLITNIIIVRKLSIENYGIYSLVLMLVGFATTFGFSWSSSSIIYYGSKERAKTGNLNKTFWSRNIILFISLTIVTLIFWVLRNQINSYLGIDLSLTILIWIYIRVLEDYLTNYLLAVKKQIISILMLFTSKTIFLIFVFLVSFNVEKLIVLNIFSGLTILLYIFSLNKSDVGKFELDYSYFKEILSFSLWQLFGFAGLYIINFGDNVVIKHFMTTKEVGLYNAAYKLFSGLASFGYVITYYYGANVSEYVQKQNKGKLNIVYFKERFIILGITFFLHIFIFLFSKQLFLLIYGQRYLQTTDIFRVLVIGSCFRYFYMFYIIFYNSTKNYKVLQSINIASAALNILLDILLINQFGLKGPAIGTTASIFIALLISIFFCEKKIKRICTDVCHLKFKEG